MLRALRMLLLSFWLYEVWFALETEQSNVIGREIVIDAVVYERVCLCGW
jgi:hypothetical protein